METKKFDNIGFFYDGTLFKNNIGEYFGVSMTTQMFQRYYELGNKIEICVRVSNKFIGDENRYTKIDLPNYHVTKSPNLSSISGLLKYSKAKRIIQKVIEKVDFAIIRLPSNIGNVAITECRKRGKPYLIELVGCPWDSLWNHSLKGKLLSIPVTMLTKNKVYKSNYVHYVTNQFLQKRYPTKGKALGCSDVELQDMNNTILEKRIEHIKNQNKIILGTTGAIDVRYKGQEYVIKALAVLKNKGISNIEYQLVGTGDNSRLKKIAESCGVAKQVKFLGGKSHKEVFDWLDSIDIYLQPSLTEGLPRSLLEAQSRALTCIGSSVGGIPELLPKECVYSIHSNIPETIANKISNLSIDEQIKYSKTSFSCALKYRRDVLQSKRFDFYTMIKKNLLRS
ncbi:glycosyltransferase [Ruminococcus albus]|uniref:glycosyltransferase n=1 Tax=Ruminococcus albus TaxID=1264 RepID=UPI0004B4D468|nr:glycosyltransferase [Ruminococcus albus]